MNTKEVVLTYEGIKKIEKELTYLKGEKRLEVADKIKQAREYGDISENSEYDEAKNEQAQVEARIAKFEKMLKVAIVIDEDNVATDTVCLGVHVKVYDYDFEEESDYYIVGSTEADPLEMKISNESPIGKALIGKKVGEEISVNVPAGVVKMKILEIHK